MPSTLEQKKPLHSILSNQLNTLNLNLTIPSSTTDQDFDFADVFGHTSSSSSSTNPNPNNLFIGDPQIIHNRSHSFIGPSPRYTLSTSLPFHQQFDPEPFEEPDEDIELTETEKDQENEEQKGKMGNNKIGPGDFEIMRVIGKGSFGKVFQVRRKGKMVIGGECEDGIYAMKVMRKDTIIKNNHVDYMKAERDILTKVVHPFVVQLRYSFQTKSKLYLILDFINGGHLFFHLYRQGIFRLGLKFSGGCSVSVGGCSVSVGGCSVAVCGGSLAVRWLSGGCTCGRKGGEYVFANWWSRYSVGDDGDVTDDG